MNDFESKVWKLLHKIPAGKITTYKQIAIALGRPNAARAVGNACNRNPEPIAVPCHRVVKSNGSIGGYSKSAKKKQQLLRKEEIKIKNNKIINFDSVLIKAEKLK